MSKVEFEVRKSKVYLIKGDITEASTDAIVNAANSSLMGGGGVDGAIHRKGGPTILEECRQIRQTEYTQGLPTGNAAITSGGKLKAKKVIHTVGPIWRAGDPNMDKLLAQAYMNSLQVASSNGLKTISFPSISTGRYGYPIEEASRIALKTVKEFLEENTDVNEVFFVLFSDFDFAVYKKAAIETF